MNKKILGETDARWPFVSLAVRLNSRTFTITGICLPDKPKTIDVFFTEFIYTNNGWTYLEDIDNEYRDLLSSILDEYFINEKPEHLGVDFVERDLIA